MPVDPPLSRRALLSGGTATLALLTACDGRDATKAVRPAADPDRDLVDRVLVELVGAQQLAVAAGLPDLALLHRTHIEALHGTAPSPSPSTAPATMTALRHSERRLQRQLVDASVAARSGPLARLFASMSAAVSQQLVVLHGEAS